MPLTYGTKRDIVFVKHCWYNAKRSLICSLSSFMNNLKEDWWVIVYAFVLTMLSSKQDSMNSFISDHIGVWMNGILYAVEGNLAVNLILLTLIFVAECFFVERYLNLKGNVGELLTYSFLFYEVTNNKGWRYADIPLLDVTYQGLLAGILCMNGILVLVCVINSHKVDEKTKKDNISATKEILFNQLPGFATSVIPKRPENTGWEIFIDSLVKRINGTDLTEESFAIGVVGEWGTGKTTFLRQMKSKMSSAYKVVEFNPWNSLSPSQLIDDFFSMLSDAVSDDTSAVKAIRKYMGVLNDIDLIPKWGGILTKYVFKEHQPENISSVKEDVQKALDKYPRRVVVLIDDLDRLEKDELFEVLRIVRITANFHNIVFVVTYDREHVDRMLKEKSITDINYLKKIFPIEINLPGYEKFVIPRMLEHELSVMLGNAEVLSRLRNNIYFRDENGRYVIQNYLKNFRDVKRFASSFALNGSHVLDIYQNNEFSIFELFWLELLRYENYSVYDTLRTNCYQYLKQSSDSDGGIKLVLQDEKDKGALDDSSFYIMRVLFSRSRKFVPVCSIVYVGNFNNYFSYRILQDTISVNEFKALYEMESAQVEEAVKTLCTTSIERVEMLRQYLLKEDPRKLLSIDERKRFMELLIDFMPYSTYEQNAQDLRSKLNKNIYPEPEREILRQHLCGQIDRSIEQKKVKDSWWLNCLSKLVNYYDVTPDFEYPYANEYSCLLTDNDLKQRGCTIFKRNYNYTNRPHICDITKYGSSMNRAVRMGTGKAGDDNDYEYNDRYTSVRYTSLIFEELLKLYAGEHSKEWKTFVEPFVDEDLWEYDQQNAIIHYHNKVRKYFGTIDNFLEFVNACFDDDEDGLLAKHLEFWHVKK